MLQFSCRFALLSTFRLSNQIPKIARIALPVLEIIGATNLGSPWISRSRSSKVIDFDTNRKRVCDFLLVRHSNLGPILHRFGDIAVFCAPES